MATYIRGSNPVWSFVDLTGHQCDDTFWMWVLENDIPYIPATVWHDENGNVEWENPIQFLANGTLPIDIFWDPEAVYRLEIRQHIDPLSPPTQSDPLIYLVENYVPGSSGNTPIDMVGLFTDNQITNAQFSIINFNSPTTFDSASGTIDVAPGWALDLVGTGDVTLTRIPLNSTLENPTNAPYALRIQTGIGFSSVKLRQRLNQNGMLWANKSVSTSVTARTDLAGVTISARMVDSQGAPLKVILEPTPVSSEFNEFTGFGTLPATTNTDTPPDAWIDYQLLLPNSTDIYVTSFQLIESELPTVFPYEQDTIDRQIDHTWHYYKDELLTKPKASILTGWNFSLNPFQFNATALTTAASQTQYIADQTILHQVSAGGTLSSGQASDANRLCLEVKAITGFANNRFALIQYIDPKTIRPYWSYLLSSLARARIFTSHGTEVGLKMRLIYSTSLPSTISPTEPIASWTGTDPVFSGSWTAIAPLNDPEYILPNDYAETEGSTDFPAFAFDAFEMPDMSSSNMTLGVVIYITENLNSALGTEDSVCFDRVSLVPNAFAVDSPPQTFDDVLSQCQFYYEKSYDVGTLPGTATTQKGQITLQQDVESGGGNTGVRLTNLAFSYRNVKRAVVSAGNVTFYSPQTGTSGQVYGFFYNNTASVTQGDIAVSNFTAVQYGEQSLTLAAAVSTIFLPTGGVFTTPWTAIGFHYTIDLRLGV